MDIFQINIIAFALAMDAFSVALMAGICGCSSVIQTVRMAFTFGFFQAFMPIIGWYAGLTAENLIHAYDHWVAFSLLAFIGGKMFWEGFTAPYQDTNDSNAIVNKDPTKGKTLLILALATSIDALAVGISFVALHISIWLPALIIGIVCCGMTAVGVRLGCLVARSKIHLGAKATMLGGIVLIGIGIKILVEHGVFT